MDAVIAASCCFFSACVALFQNKYVLVASIASGLFIDDNVLISKALDATYPFVIHIHIVNAAVNVRSHRLTSSTAFD
jgi:hypothetical protein